MVRPLRVPVSALTSHLGYWMRFVSNHVSYAFARRVEAQGVTVAEWALMRELYGGALAPSRLAERLGMTRGAITKLADRVIAKALVARTASSEDGRAQTLALTSGGEQLVPVLARLADENDTHFFGHFSAEERAVLERMLREMVARHGFHEVPLR